MSYLKNKLFCLLNIFFFVVSTSSVSGITKEKQDVAPAIDIVSSNSRELVFNIAFPAPIFSESNLSEKGYYNISVAGCYKPAAPGFPNLPLWNRLIELPVGSSYQISVQNQVVKNIEIPKRYLHYKVVPVQPPIPKTEGERPPFTKESDVYTTDQWFDYGTVRIEDDGIMRHTRIARLSVSPVQYNPVSNKLRYIEKATIKIEFSEPAGTDEVLKEKYATPMFSLSDFTLNGTAFSQYPVLNGPIHYVILSDSMFMSALQPFVNWKSDKGFVVTEVYKGSPGVGNTPSAMRAYLKNLYDNPAPSAPAPSYLLIVGDVNQIPAFTGDAISQVTDLYYAEYTNDNYPELEYGRFSATTVAQLIPQIEKTMMVEQCGMPSVSYLQNGLLIAGNDKSFSPIYANGQMYYAENEYINSSNGMIPHPFLYPASSGLLSQIIQTFNNGVSFVNYSAHATASGWTDPPFTSGTVQSLTNTGRYPTVISNACETNKFNLSQCFGESLLRAENKGAVGHIGASDLTYWDEDYHFSVGYGQIVSNPSYQNFGLGYYDCLFHTHGEPYNNWFTTQGGIIQAGNLSVTQSGSMVKYYWEAYHLMGDPSLMPWLGIPAAPQVSFPKALPTGITSVNIQAEPYQYVAISYNGVIYGAGVADGTGYISLQIQPFASPANALLAVTGQNLIPYFDTIQFLNFNGPYLWADSISYTDQGGNSNQVIEAGEVIEMDVRIKNYTSFAAGNFSATLVISDPYILLIDSVSTLLGLSGMSDTLIENAFEVKIADNTPDQHVAKGVIRINDGATQWNVPVSFLINSPTVEIKDVIITDFSGNNNGILEPNEPFEFVVKIKNGGHSSLPSLEVVLEQNSPLISLNISKVNIPNFDKGNTHTVHFSAVVGNNQIPIGSVVKLKIAAAQNGYGDTATLYRMLSALKEDFEDSSLTAGYNWQFSGSQHWHISTDNPYEGDYCLRSGAIPNQSTTSISTEMTVLGQDTIRFAYKVSSEEDYDFLIFSVDQHDVARWSGISPDWEMAAIAVDSGHHKFTWSYKKDFYVTEGEDCAWIDYIIFPVTSLYTSIENPDTDSGKLLVLEARPNPTHGNVQVTVETRSAKGGKLLVFDMAGNILFERNVDNMKGDYTIPSETFSKGMYMIVLEADNAVLSRKIIRN